MPKVLTNTLYCYVEAGNAQHARREGAKLFGSFSAYVNALIAKDRGVFPKLGQWKAKGESKAIRDNKKSKPSSSKKSVSTKAGTTTKSVQPKKTSTLDKLANGNGTKATVTPPVAPQTETQPSTSQVQ